MKLIDRYLLKELINPFIFGLVSFVLILSGSTTLIPLMTEAAKYGMPFFVVIHLFILQLPNVIVYSFPMAMLLAAIISFGRLSADLEIIAFRSGGINFTRLLVPVGLFGLMISLLTIWFNESIVPRSYHVSQNLIISYQQKDIPKIKKNINLTQYDPLGLPERIINVNEVNNEQLKDITVAEYDSGKLARLIFADSGKWLKNGGWEFYDGIMHVFSQENKSKILYLEFKKELIDIQLNMNQNTNREKSIEEMNTKELKNVLSSKKVSAKFIMMI